MLPCLGLKLGETQCLETSLRSPFYPNDSLSSYSLTIITMRGDKNSAIIIATCMFFFFIKECSGGETCKNIPPLSL